MRNSYTSSSKGYVWRLLVLQAVLILVYASSSVVLVKYKVEPNDTLIKRAELIRNGTARDAAFGDSHIVWGVVGSQDFVTLGTEGETIPDMEVRVRYYFRDKKPGKIIIQGDPHSFATYKLQRGTHEYLRDMGDSFWQRFVGHHRQYLNQYWGKVIAARDLDVFRPKYEIRWGWVVSKNRWSSVDPSVRMSASAARVRRQTPIAEFRRHEFAESYRRTLSFLKGRGANICVVTTPVSHDYYTQAETSPTTAEALRFFEETAREHNTRYVNYFGLYAEPTFNDYFADMDHLNAAGAPQFTAKLLSECFAQPPRLQGAEARVLTP